jgi:glutathione S-transferase
MRVVARKCHLRRLTIRTPRQSRNLIAKKENAFGEIPVLVDDDFVLRDSQAILIYLARKYGSEAWLPIEPRAIAEVAQWLMVAANEVARGPNDAQLHDKFGVGLDHAAAVAKATLKE